eukprot:2168922-Amphidinium_carterae.1
MQKSSNVLNQVRVDQETGHLKLTPEAMAADQPEGASAKELPLEQGRRWALVNQTTYAPGAPCEAMHETHHHRTAWVSFRISGQA